MKIFVNMKINFMVFPVKKNIFGVLVSHFTQLFTNSYFLMNSYFLFLYTRT